MVELLASNQRTRVRFSPAAPRHVEYTLVSNGGRRSPDEYGYHIVPVYNTPVESPKHRTNIKWIEENLTDNWTWFAFGATFDGVYTWPSPGISYCFKKKEDAGIFTLCKAGPNDGMRRTDERRI